MATPSSFKPDAPNTGLPSSFKADAPPAASFADSIWESLAGYGSNVAKTLQGAGNAVNTAFTDTTKNPLQQGFDASVQAVKGGTNVAASLVPGAQKVLGGIGNATAAGVNFAGNISSHLDDAAQALGLMTTAQRQKQDAMNSDFANSKGGDLIHGVATVGQGVGDIAGTILGANGSAISADSAIDIVKNISSTAKGVGNVADILKPEIPKTQPVKSSPATDKIQELISPKVDAKATRLALAEGRILPGQEPGFLRDGTPDQIMPSKQTVRAAETIKRQIPSSEDMSQPQLHAALDSKISSIATKLKPEMQAVPISDEIVGKMQDIWEALKNKQAEDPYTSTGANLEKLQAQFEKNFLEPVFNKNAEAAINKSLGVPNAEIPTMDDLWERAKAYDQSVPSNVKNANSLSTDVLQTQKSIWLQNRAVLRGAINDVATGLGETSQKAFADMHDMYNAQKGIQSSYKIPKEGTPSQVKEFMNKPAVRAVKTVAKVGLGLEGARRLLTGEF